MCVGLLLLQLSTNLHIMPARRKQTPRKCRQDEVLTLKLTHVDRGAITRQTALLLHLTALGVMRAIIGLVKMRLDSPLTRAANAAAAAELVGLAAAAAAT